jgi:hypothetical protein
MEIGMIGVLGSKWWRAMVLTGAVACGAFGTQVASAHHSFAQFDQNKAFVLKGTVKSWEFTNPHSWLQLVCVQNGQEVEYSVEGASVSTLVRRGWSRTTFKVGDKVTIEIYPSRDASKKEGALLKATFEDGRTISTGITPV